MRRMLAALLVVILVLVALIFLISQGGEVASIIQRGQSIISLILALLQLVGIALAVGLVVFVLVQYALYIRFRTFIFEGFNNASKLIDVEKMPLDLDMLAQEELNRQYKIIFNKLKGYSGKSRQDFEAFLDDELYFGEDLSETDIGKYESEDQVNNSGMIVDLKEAYRILNDPKNDNSMNVGDIVFKEVINPMDPAAEIAPKEVTPILKFIEAVVPPHIIRATGHLQWRNDISGRAGITFELKDLGSQSNLMIRTIWWRPPDTMVASEDMQPPSESNIADETLTNKASGHYIELLKPAMYWLALMLWEQKLISQGPFLNRILKAGEKRRQARIFYLLGALYYAQIEQFRAYKEFFYQLAVEHFRQASFKDSSWPLPCLYLGYIYSYKALESREVNVRLEKFQKIALHFYEDALERAKKLGSIHTLQRTLVAKAWIELASGNKDLADIASQEIEQLERLGPANFDPQRSDCGFYLYNLALCYILAEQTDTYFHDIYGKVRRTLAYCLVRAWEMKDMIKRNLKSFPDLVIYLNLLEQVLNKKLDKLSQLNRLHGESFDAEIDEILKEVEELLLENLN